jgi:hypothetical protein
MDQALWAVTFAEDLILIAVLFVRSRARSYPFFTALIGLDVARTVALFLIQRHGTKATYFYSYWSLALVDVLLQLTVLYRVALHIFRSTGEWVRGARKALMWLVVVCVVVGVVLTWIPNPAVVLRLQVVLLKGNFLSAVLVSELSVGIFALSVRAGLPWNTHVTRIMHGFIVYSLCTMVLETARTYFGVTATSHAYDGISHVRIAVYILCMAYWIVTLWWEAPPTRQMTDMMRRQLSAVQDALVRRDEMRRAGAKA